jgi:CcmD family protein
MKTLITQPYVAAKKTVAIICSIFLSLSTAAQETEIDMATDLRSSGKIYVVVIVLAVIFIGLIAYLFSIDRRLKRLEKK